MKGTRPIYRRQSGLDIQHFYGKKLWGHGRFAQICRDIYCRLKGHAYTDWHYDWPWDVPEYWEERGEPYRNPYDWERLMWSHHCRRGCGRMEMTMAAINDMVPDE